MRGKLDVSDPALRNRFVTGDWDAAEARAEAQPLDESLIWTTMKCMAISKI